jgi:hypothetical protein
MILDIDSADSPGFHSHFDWSVCSVPVGILNPETGAAISNTAFCADWRLALLLTQ